jgi:glycerate kinase
MTVRQVADAMADGVRRARPEASIDRMPVSDGGPGLIDSIQDAEDGLIRIVRVPGPLGGSVEARSLWSAAGEAVIEAADACGLHLMPEGSRDPLGASTIGVGELVGWCVEQGARRIYLGLGGSGTVDGGTGLAGALGYELVNAAGEALPPGGGGLSELALIRSPANPPELPPVTAIADVRSPLLGPDGAARRFGPQKGASPSDVEVLETCLARLADRIRQDLGRDLAGIPGSGAAGGLGTGCAAFLGADLVGGSDWVLERVRFDAALREADLVVTGEGEYDATSGLGKVVWEIVRRCREAGVPAVLACGRFSGDRPEGVTVIDGGGRWLGSEDLSRMVAEAVA